MYNIYIYISFGRGGCNHSVVVTMYKFRSIAQDKMSSRAVDPELEH